MIVHFKKHTVLIRMKRNELTVVLSVLKMSAFVAVKKLVRDLEKAVAIGKGEIEDERQL